MNSQFGESFVGSGVDAAHINTVLGSLGGPVEVAWVTALASPRAGHAAFVAAVQPGIAVRPHTLFVNKATIASDRHGQLTWGAAQAGVAGGVLDAVADDIIPSPAIDGLLLIVAVWVNPDATDERAVYENNRSATRQALEAGQLGLPAVDTAVSARTNPWNAYFSPPDS